jgi:hypothetical protein
MTELLTLGVTLPEIVAMVTNHPAKMLKLEDSLGSLQVGREADISVLEMRRGRFELRDRRILQHPPAVHEQHARADLAANCISWVTTSIVMPSSARARITSSTSPTSSGSSAEVGSSNSISTGASPSRARSPRAAAARPTAAPAASRVVRQPHPVQLLRGQRARLGQLHPEHAARTDRDVVQRAQMREQIEALEHHADAPALARGRGGRSGTSLPLRISPAMLTPSSRTSPSSASRCG